MTQTVLRSRSGCQRCRIRRKKCDEKKPICGSCQRLNLYCTWKSADTSNEKGTDPFQAKAKGLQLTTNGGFKRVPLSHNPNLLSGMRNLGSGYQPFRDQAQFDLAMRTSVILRDLISASANPEFRDTSLLTSLALKNDWLRDALASFSAHQDDRLRAKVGPVFYSRAVTTLRSHIGAVQGNGALLEVLAAMIFMGMSDVSQFRITKRGHNLTHS